MNANKKAVSFWLIFVFLLCSASPVFAGTPSGTNWFQLLASPFTGGDNTGDGGTGLPADYNYYYVGQTWTETMQIRSDNTNASNIWIDYDGQYAGYSNLLTGTYFANWSGQTVTTTGGTNYRLKSTGYRTSGNSSGVGTFGSVQYTAVKPTAAAYGIGSPTALDINIGTVGLTTESNISYLGNDIMDDAEDFNMHIWADTKKPYALDPNPSDGAAGLLIDANFTFDLRDSKNGEGDNSGVGTGVNTTEPPGFMTFDDGVTVVSYVAYDSFSCSGIWGTNLCSVVVNPPSPASISGDTRNWKYGTTYTVTLGGFRDYASASQDQLGDANGPNTMLTKIWTFTTESDTVPPRVIAESPARGSTGNSVSTDVSVDVVDKKAHPGTISGEGVDSATCRIRIDSATVGSTIYQQGDAGVTVTVIDYGYRYTINPAINFAQNETVSVRVSDCQDLASNTMVTDNYTFTTIDSDGPYVDNVVPANDATITQSDNITFHIKDDGLGVDLANTVFYINGIYYSDGGGAGTVTTNGTRITFASSLDFNGGNYGGDTTDRTGTASDYAFTIDPQTNFAVGESVPVIIYTRDISGNLMERYVYGLTVAGAGCPLGSTYCGANSTWNVGLSQCLGTGGGSGGGGGGGGGSTPTAYINPLTASVNQIDSTSALVIWYSSLAGDSRVVYGTDAPDTLGSSPNYGYQYSSQTVDSNSVYHSMVINGLQQGELYYFRPISVMNGQTVIGPQMLMSPAFGTQIITTPCEKTDCPVCDTKPSECKPTTQPTTPPVVHPSTPEEQVAKLVTILGIEIQSIEKTGKSEILLNGTAEPLSALTMIVTNVNSAGQSVPLTYNLESDASGNWDATISNNLSVGPHVITVQDEDGNSDDAIMYIVKGAGEVTEAPIIRQNKIIIDGVARAVPGWLYWPIIVLSILSLLLSLFLTGLARRTDRREKELAKVNLSESAVVIPEQQEIVEKKVHHYLNYSLVIAAVALVIVVLIGIWLNRQTNFLSRFFHMTPAVTFIEEINGQIVDPFTRTGIVGADLVSGQTSIHTGTSGNFIFSNVNAGKGIRVTHPGLLRPLVILPSITPNKQRIDILFNEQMYMTLVRVLDDEARGQIGDIYAKYLSPDVKSKVAEDVFKKKYTTIVTAKNITDQQITISSMKVVDNYNLNKYPLSIAKAVALTLNINGQKAVYILQQVGDKWYVAK